MENLQAVNPYISIVIPVYRSEQILPLLVRKIDEAMQIVGQRHHFELVLVNDASPDNSWQVIEQLAKQYKFVVGVCLMKNAGEHNAVMAGLRHGRGEIFVIMDDDLQHAPEVIPLLVTAIQSGHDVCYTKFVNCHQHAFWKRGGSWFNDKVATILLRKPPDLYLSSFKALHKRVIDEIIKYEGPYPYVDGLILNVTRNITTIDVHHQPRHMGTGNYNLSRSISLWLKMVTNFSVLPLRMATILGGAIAFVSIIFIMVVVIQKILYPEIAAGWTSLVTVMLFMGGVQLCALGIIGEYIGRTYLNVNKKPQYAIRSVIYTKDGEAL